MILSVDELHNVALSDPALCQPGWVCYIFRLSRDNGKEMEAAIIYLGSKRGYGQQMEAAIIYWGNIGITEKK